MTPAPSPTPLSPQALADASVDGVQAVRDILAYLEEQTNIVADFQTVTPREVSLSPDGVSGQLALLGMLRQALDQSLSRMQAE